MKSAIAVTIAAVAVAGALILLYSYGTDGISIQSLLGTHATIPQDIADANNAFAVDFYRQVSASENHAGKNLFFSPTSMYTAFSALYEGAKEDTAAQMEDVFGFEFDMEQRHDQTRALLSSLNRDDPHATLNLANALWVAQQYSLNDSYVDTMQDIYLAHVEGLDFAGDTKGSADRINRWASESTNDKIKQVITPDDLNGAIAMINNAIYFKGTWLEQFPEESTRKDDFWTSNSSVRADFMYMREDSTFNYSHSDGVQVLHLPYKGDRLSMLVILPDDRDGIKDLEDSLSADLVRKWQNTMEETEVYVMIPKFEMKTNYDLNRHLEAMGMHDIFDEGTANLSGIANTSTVPGNIYISKSTQDAYVKVNEEGTEAAAVTTAKVTQARLGPQIPLFKADHPFVFVIQDDHSGTILFMGKVTDPTAG